MSGKINLDDDLTDHEDNSPPVEKKPIMGRRSIKNYLKETFEANSCLNKTNTSQEKPTLTVSLIGCILKNTVSILTHCC